MNRRFVAYLLGWLLLLATAFLFVPLVSSLIFGESPAPYLGAMTIAGIGGFVLVKVHPPVDRHIRPRDACRHDAQTD